MFDRFAHDPDSSLAVLRETTATMLALAQRLRGTTRCHRPSRAEPHIVLLVDELATLTAYADRSASTSGRVHGNGMSSIQAADAPKAVEGPTNNGDRLSAGVARARRR